MPVAVLQGATRFFIYADHLNTSRFIINTNDVIVWRWDAGPFGPELPQGTIGYNLRFPGQYFDQETGLHYNYFRDYHPLTGRYIQSDPIGIAGGLNTYRYSLNDPLSFFDPDGLDVEVGVRKFYPVPVPYARHCFVRFNKNNSDTLSFDLEGVHGDDNPKGGEYSPTKDKQNDSYVKKEMKKCKGGQYDFLDFNCCMCIKRLADLRA